MKGFTQIYTGDGKGKTTAALGLIVRATGAGLRVYFAQFLKGGKSAEIRTLQERFPDVTVEAFGSGRLIRGKPTSGEIDSARQGLVRIGEVLSSRRYDVVIADELNVVVAMGMIGVKEVLALIRDKPDSVEFILTGRSADKRLCKAADLVTEVRCIKHYYCRGVAARKGIEK
ncbi:MAG: cob(I)yrinic acid a,c-diamide adenosyltransferase [bacterium]